MRAIGLAVVAALAIAGSAKAQSGYIGPDPYGGDGGFFSCCSGYAPVGNFFYTITTPADITSSIVDVAVILTYTDYSDDGVFIDGFYGWEVDGPHDVAVGLHSVTYEVVSPASYEVHDHAFPGCVSGVDEGYCGSNQDYEYFTLMYGAYVWTAPGSEGMPYWVTVRDASDPVPEPAMWMLMIAGFGLTGAALRRRRSLAG